MERRTDYYRVTPEYTFVNEESIAAALQYFTTMMAYATIALCWDADAEEDTLLKQFLHQLSEQPNITVIPS